MELNKWAYCHGFKVFYKNDFELEFLVNEIFVEGCYFFESENERPLIIDCGAHIGLSVLYFKQLFPLARIIAFEPDPNSFRLLKKNMEANGLMDVELHNVAVADFDGEAIMKGDFSGGSESVGNSIVPEWSDRPGYKSLTVPVRDLNGYLGNEPIDYLKIDTEGTEKAILCSIKDKLQQVAHIYVEFHEYDRNRNDLEQLVHLLNRHHIATRVGHIDLYEVLAKKYPAWALAHQPAVHIIYGKNENTTFAISLA